MTNSIRPSTRDAIVEAAFAVFSKDPSAALSDVATLAGVGRATLHRHFSSRDDLIRQLAKIANQEMDDAVDAACADVASYSEAVRKSLHALIPLGDRYGFLELEPIDDDPELKAAFERQKRETEAMVDAAKGEGLFDTAIPTSWIVQAYDHLLYAGWESVKAGGTTPDQAADLAWRTLTTGLGTQKQ
ncbi:MAG: TetR/AcrR family transcriptional regulator [Hyphomonadaceae bacterium]|nr:TetR/AcrR family transcriptional regulator [Hyphomonadaceae bacterium]